MNLQSKLQTLRLKKVMLFSNIESLSEIDDSLFTQFGKVEAEILKIEKQIVRETINNFE